MVMPATNSTSERSFSPTRYVKSYLRSTMSQEKFNNLMVLYVHKQYTDSIKLCDSGNDLLVKVSVEVKYLVNFRLFVLHLT